MELIFSLDLLSFFLQSLLLTNYKLFNIVFFINLLALVTVVDRSVNFVLNYIIFDTFVHHIEAVFNIIFGPSRHLLNNFCPFVSYLQSFFKKLDILFKWKRIFLYIRIQEIYPSFTALLSISKHRMLTDAIRILHSQFSKIFIQHFSNLIPMPCSILLYDFNKLFVFLFDPTALFDWILLFLTKSILTLSVISARNEASNLYPVCLSYIFVSFTIILTVFIDRPNQELVFFYAPSLLRLIALATLKLR